MFRRFKACWRCLTTDFILISHIQIAETPDGTTIRIKTLQRTRYADTYDLYALQMSAQTVERNITRDQQAADETLTP